MIFAAIRNLFSKEKEFQSGFSILELLVSTMVVGVIMISVVGTVQKTRQQSMNHEIINNTNEQARALLDYFIYDIRMAGSGIPFYQSGFRIGDSNLGTAPQPILTTASSTFLPIRMNEKGKETALTADYTPSSTHLTLSAYSTADFVVGDIIYISDVTQGGSSGFQGTVNAKSSNSLTVNSTYVSTPGATFKSGSIIGRVASVSYNSPGDWSGITRDNGTTSVTLAPNSQFSLVYRDCSGTALSLPLTTDVIKNTLCSVEVSISVRSSRALLNGEQYTANVNQLVTMRNLIFSR